MTNDLKRTGLVADSCFLEHKTGRGHPECPERFSAALAGVRKSVDSSKLLDIPVREATSDELMLGHSEFYIQTVRENIMMGRCSLSTGDTDICPQSLDVASRAVGGTLNAVDAVLDGKIKNAFCVLRPPGHHAEPDRGMGFCIFNNAAIAARYAQQHAGIERVLIADWDVHHGNGTQFCFYNDPSVFYFSTHQWPCYPGTGMVSDIGTDAGRGFTMNVPLASGSARDEVVGAFERKLIPAMREFKPQFVIISAGFDAEAGDPLGGFGLEEADFIDLTRIVMKIADKYAEGRLISVLEGGYRLDGLADLCGAHVVALADFNYSS